MSLPDLYKVYQKSYIALRDEHNKMVAAMEKKISPENEKAWVKSIVDLQSAFKAGHFKEVKLALKAK